MDFTVKNLLLYTSELAELGGSWGGVSLLACDILISFLSEPASCMRQTAKPCEPSC